MQKLIIALSVAAAVVHAGNSGSFVMTVNDNTGVYERETRKLYDKPLFTVGRNDHLMVVATKGRYVKVQNNEGGTGWVEKRLLRRVSSRSFVFGSEKVSGYLENPELVLLLVGDDPIEEAIRLDRSFKECLLENVDRETAQRIVK